MAQLHCAACDETQPVPTHCGQPMHVDRVDGVEMLVCHMGPGCGKEPIPRHHGAAMTIRD